MPSGHEFWQTGAPWIAILATFGLGVWNLFVGLSGNRKTRFINTVTNQRVLWIEQLRQDIATLISLAGGMAGDTTKAKSVAKDKETRLELHRLRRVITLRLNPDDPEDQKIQKLLPVIEHLALTADPSNIADKRLDELAERAQKLLKAEWDKVKLEAEQGRLKTVKDARRDAA